MAPCGVGYPACTHISPKRKYSMNSFEQQPLILLVDDEQEVLDEVSAVLCNAGFECRCCTDADEAIDEAKVNSFDLIISDINLNGRSGLEMCEQIKRNEDLENVPVMFLSGAQIPDIIRRSHAAGGTYYLRKPFDPEVLVELIDKALWMPHLVSAHADRRQTVGSA